MPLADPFIGRTLANYKIERLLGRGGMASVYYGFDSQLQRPAAIKVIDERYTGDASYAERFVHEARAMASWRHPNIPQIYQAGVENGIYFYAMEYINGMDLEEMLRRYGQKGELLPYKDILLIAKAVTEALDYAHHKGAIHRDVKPSNILISEDDRILLTDFGLVLEIDKGTRGEVFGSPQYIAPEQARSSADAVAQSDLYALGVILYEMLVGRLPFDDPSPASLAIKHITLEPPAPRTINPDLSPEVETVLLKTLQKLPQARYQTGQALMAALEDAITEQSTAARIIHSVPPPPATLTSLPVDLDNRAQVNLPEPGPIDRQPPEADNPSPAQSVDTREKIIPVGVNRPRPAVLKKRYIIGAVLGLSFLTLLCVFIFGTAWLLTKLNRTFSFGSVQPSATPVNFLDQATPTVSGDPGITPLAPSPSAHVNEFHLSLSAQKADNLLLINQGTVGVPLAQLRFGDQKNKLTGDEWGVEMLQPGQCVTVSKSPGHPEAPAGVQCELVGKNLTRGGPNKFWDSAFDVYFQNVFVASCDLKNTSCDLQFSNSP